MTLPATGISLSAVNTELFNSGTLTLDNLRVRSLGSTAGGTGTTFSMSSLANKATTHAFTNYPTATQLGTGFGEDFSPGAVMSHSSQQRLYTFGTTKVLSTDGTVVLNTPALLSYYISGDIGIQYGYRISNGASRMGLFGLSTNFAYMSLQEFNEPFAVLLKINLSNGSVHTARNITQGGNYVRYRSRRGVIAEDSSGNIYLSTITPDNVRPPADLRVMSALMSFDSSLNFRWARYLNESATASTEVYTIGVDSSNRVYTVTQEGWNGTGDQNAVQTSVMLSRFSSTGTLELQTRIRAPNAQFRNENFGGVSCGAFNNSGTMAIVTDRVLTPVGSGTPTPSAVYINSSGTILWSAFLNSASYGHTGGTRAALAANGDLYTVTRWQYSVNFDNRYLTVIVKYNSSGTVIWMRQFWFRSTQTINSEPARTFNFSDLEHIELSSNDNILTISTMGGFQGEYSRESQAIAFSINTNGSGTGTYILPVSPPTDFNIEVIYETDVFIASTSYTSTTLSTKTFNSSLGTFAYPATSVSSSSLNVTNYKVNI
jgi:hypothetical protein